MDHANAAESFDGAVLVLNQAHYFTRSEATYPQANK
jgi:hypothetical protein